MSGYQFEVTHEGRRFWIVLIFKKRDDADGRYVISSTRAATRRRALKKAMHVADELEHPKPSETIDYPTKR